MMDLPFTLIRFTDESRVELDGTAKPFRLAIFMLGKFGPFTERFPRDTFTENDLIARVSTLRQQLEAIHR